MSLDRLWRDSTLGFSLDWSACPAFSDDSVAWTTVFSEMAALEGGAIANPDEGRQVGHYWLRTPELAPDGLGAQIRAVVSTCKKFAFALKKEGKFKTALILGIGGSALGPAFLSSALQEPEDWMRLVFIDNTDPEGMARVIGPLDLEETLVVCISKSGGTPETRNALIEVQAAFVVAGLPFAEHAVAISQEGSRLWKEAEGWKLRLPMWDWVGGRTSVTSAVGLLPLALQGADVELLLEGAAAMDAATRLPDLEKNPAAILARAWYNLGEGRGKRAMVVLPYRDRLLLFSRYLQQLVMESLGKEKDLAGKLVYQGLTVYGNKGSTDQHAYVQQ
ncbi:MAG TPA: glucose-6-phosphate isomerase, partial [Myxococcota bacterium]|nr:glucose-6-phosphate isomerase [Myxococcota bacterium]